jgi:hypothetical protein
MRCPRNPLRCTPRPKNVLGNRKSLSCIYPLVAAFEHPATLKAKGKTMRPRKINVCLLAVAMATPVFTTGCAVHAYYDPYYHDYHPVDGEVVYYGQWETETHRQHVDLKHRNKAEQKEYWDWRHKHGDPH